MVSWDIDHYLNRFIPAPRLNRLPRWISHFLGYREHARKSPLPEYLIWFWSFIGAFLGIVLIEGVFKSSHVFDSRQTPLIIGSYGASAILLYNAVESPLSQPRNVFFGHFLCAAIGVGITKLFMLLGEARYEDLRWLVGGICVAVASALMGMTKTVHPPAGATALLAAVDPNVRHLGWFLLPVITVSCLLAISVALIVNNIQRRYPVYWWTPLDLERPENNRIEEEEQGKNKKKIDIKEKEHIGQGEEEEDVEKQQQYHIRITTTEIDIPLHFMLAEEEKKILRILQGRLELVQRDSDGNNDNNHHDNSKSNIVNSHDQHHNLHLQPTLNGSTSSGGSEKGSSFAS